MDSYLPEPANRGADHVHTALQALVQQPDTDEVRGALQTLCMYFKNILDNVDETKYRRISYTNPRYKRFAAKFASFERLFIATGFVANGTGALEWQPLAQSLDSKAKADEASVQLLRFAHASCDQARAALPPTAAAAATAAVAGEMGAGARRPSGMSSA